jgi:hypothetical protein
MPPPTLRGVPFGESLPASRERHSLPGPLPSFCTISTSPVRRAVSFAETVKAVWWWVTGHHVLSLREQIRDARLVERLAEEIAEEETPQPPAPAPRQPKRT